MKKIGDETFAHETGDYRTLWYGYIDQDVNDQLIQKLVTIIANDSAMPVQRRTVNHWIFYFKDQNEDALGEQVRQSIMIRQDINEFAVNFNLSDFSFVTKFNKVIQFKADLLSELKKLV